VCCVDEKTGIQALDRTQPDPADADPGQVERRTHDYVRNGITDLFAALNVATGEVIATTRRRHGPRNSRPSSWRSTSRAG